MPYLAACIAAFVALNLLSYFGNKFFAFRLGRSPVAAEIVRYYLVMAVSLAVNLTLMYVLVAGAGFHYLMASASVSVILAVANFAAHAGFSFKWRNEQAGCGCVVQVSPFFPSHGGGIEVVAGWLAAEHGAAGQPVVWFAGLGSGDSVPVVRQGMTVVPVRYVDPLEAWVGLPLPIWSPQGLARLWREVNGASVVHVHDFLYFPSIMAILMAKMASVPVVLTQHIGELPFRSGVAGKLVSLLNKTLGRLILGSADQVVFIAAPVMEFFGTFVRYRRSPILIPNGVDHSIYTQGERSGSGAVIELLFVGRFVEKKGIHYLRQCLDLEGVRWTFVGKGVLSPDAWTELPSDARVIQDARGDDVVPFYQQADLLVLPSIGEGFPLVVQESLACGTPVLVGEVVARTCPNRDPACVFDVSLDGPDPVHAVRVAIEVLARDRGRLASARTAASRLAAQWSWKGTAAKYREVYAAVRGVTS